MFLLVVVKGLVLIRLLKLIMVFRLMFGQKCVLVIFILWLVVFICQCVVMMLGWWFSRFSGRLVGRFGVVRFCRVGGVSCRLWFGFLLLSVFSCWCSSMIWLVFCFSWVWVLVLLVCDWLCLIWLFRLVLMWLVVMVFRLLCCCIVCCRMFCIVYCVVSWLQIEMIEVVSVRCVFCLLVWVVFLLEMVCFRVDWFLFQRLSLQLMFRLVFFLLYQLLL